LKTNFTYNERNKIETKEKEKQMSLRNKTVIQIGSHIGNTKNDPLFASVDETTRLILVEPVPYLFEELKKNYERKMNGATNNIVFINKAVSNFIGEIELTIVSPKNDFDKFPPWASQLSSINTTHIKSHLPNLMMETRKVPTTTLDAIIAENGITEIELLQTDTEGHDYVILMNYTYNVKPKRIMFEHKHMDGTFLTGEHYSECLAFLQGMNYKMLYQDTEDTLMELCHGEKN
jgi:FkbM family methyltransferase